MLGDILVADDGYIVCRYNDMRKFIDGLCAIIIAQFSMSPVTVLVTYSVGRRVQTKSYMWVRRTDKAGLLLVILYGYSETRADGNAKNFLNGFK